MKNYLNIGLRILLIIISLNFIIIEAFTQQKFTITDYGYKPGERKNVIPALINAMKDCATKDSSIIVFPKGRYDFWQDFASEERSTIGIKMEKLKNVTIDGEGSDFIFHGNMQIASILGCENITLYNFSVDWEHPFIYQGKYMAATDDYIDIWFDPKEYPYVIEDSLFYLTGEGWKTKPNTIYSNLYDKTTKEILYNTSDGNNSSVFLGKAEEIEPGIVRFHGKTNIRPEPGTFTTLFAGRYMTIGINISESKNTNLKD